MANEQVVYNIDTILNVVKRRDSFRIVSSSSRDNVNIAYITGDEVASDLVLKATDESGSLRSNWTDEDTLWEEFTATSKILKYYHFLITDIIVGGAASGSIPSTPLFWKHTLQKQSNRLIGGLTGETLHPTDPDISYLDIKVLNKKMEEYSDPAIQYDLTTGTVYSNLENNFNYKTGQWQLYFVRYAIRFKNSSGNYVNHIYTDLLSQAPVYHEATVDDFLPDLSLDPTKKAYSITENPGYIEVVLPQSADYAVRPLYDNKIKLVIPEGKTTSNPWFLSVTNGRALDLKTAVPYIYDVPEYLTLQSFDPYPPFKYEQDEETLRVKKSIYKISKAPLVVPALSNGVGSDADMHIILKAYDKENTLRAIFTTDSELFTTQDSIDTGLYWKAIIGVDLRGGMVHIDTELPSSYTLYATYYYEEPDFEITDIDFNPTTNNDIIEKVYSIYLIPEATGYGSPGRSASIHYLRIDKNGIIEYTSQDGSDGNFTPPTTWIGMAYETWKEQFTLSEPTDTYGGRLLVLGEVWVAPNQQPGDLDHVDIRVEGGGVREDILEALFQ